MNFIFSLLGNLCILLTVATIVAFLGGIAAIILDLWTVFRKKTLEPINDELEQCIKIVFQVYLYIHIVVTILDALASGGEPKWQTWYSFTIVLIFYGESKLFGFVRKKIAKVSQAKK